MATTRIAIYGAGGHAREIAWVVQSCNRRRKMFDFICFVDEPERIRDTVVNGFPVLAPEAVRDRFPDAKVVVAAGDPGLRHRLVEEATAAGFDFQTVIHPGVERSKWIDIGLGSVICAGTTITTNVQIGKHVHINLSCTVSHDVVIGDFTTLSPGAHVCGSVLLGTGVYIGAGATIINGTRDEPLIVGDHAIVGAGACAVGSIPRG